MYPAFLKLDGRAVLIVGAGPVAAGKLEGLLARAPGYRGGSDTARV
jgi:siroheme synthase (precorrin-2 oxidase/ferrochelatase)